jgi:uncharacterized protein YajQ (UPF0234 family)
MKGAGGMNTLKSSREKEKSCASEPHRLKKRIGSIVYEVEIHFNQGAKETMDKKIMRLIKNDMEAVS